ncbi:pentatricopeptide repeat-containing protein [Tanacetum coccineum]|uniref:Pentatricopeptide repeat-containing protein n=1 Tax=Tanacetum coccineum TaxID=301880 RepID=A0ABQ5BW66_9ASTR
MGKLSGPPAIRMKMDSVMLENYQGCSKEEALKQKDIYEMSWGNATQRMVEQATTLMFRKRRNNTMRDNLMIMLKNCQFTSSVYTVYSLFDTAYSLSGEDKSSLRIIAGDYEARRVLGKMDTTDQCSWNSMVSGFGRYDRFEDCLSFVYVTTTSSLLKRQNEDFGGHLSSPKVYVQPPSSSPLPSTPQSSSLGLSGSALSFGKAKCSNLKGFGRTCPRQELDGKNVKVHGSVVKSLYEKDVYIWSALIDMYAKCGNVGVAEGPELHNQVMEFNKFRDDIVVCNTINRNIVSWNALISGYMQNGDSETALKLFLKLNKDIVFLMHYTFGNLLGAHATLLI